MIRVWPKLAVAVRLLAVRLPELADPTVGPISALAEAKQSVKGVVSWRVVARMALPHKNLDVPQRLHAPS